MLICFEILKYFQLSVIAKKLLSLCFVLLLNGQNLNFLEDSWPTCLDLFSFFFGFLFSFWAPSFLAFAFPLGSFVSWLFFLPVHFFFFCLNTKTPLGYGLITKTSSSWFSILSFIIFWNFHIPRIDLNSSHIHTTSSANLFIYLFIIIFFMKLVVRIS